MVEVSITVTDPIAVFRLVEQSGCTTYDIEYVLLARELGLPLVTADAEVVQAFPDIALGLDAFVNRS